ncbi:Leucine-rich repeat receptor protein kinase MSP1 [Dichanthelium oligosanthes]|uniref:Leucine-rich repeat receptor protein kinase MSP1 n=1 Tax=Dichanthelium oligosanthes TaxID=888268 RepID=A0A1E5VYF1_9POAL|nr:Leucine-rich repeat receptor protein kinase MSP1 [Dichanthelium oligosanthes]
MDDSLLLLSLFLPRFTAAHPPIHHVACRPVGHAMDVPVLVLVVVAGAAAAVAVPCLLLAFLCQRRRKNLKPYTHRRCGSSPPSGPTLPVSTPEYSSSWSFYGSAAADACLQKLSLADLAAATGGFSPDKIIGDGSFGFVYRAVLPSGAAVAVKRLSRDGAAGTGDREFLAELEVLGSLSHPNLARLLGYCASGRDRILVYELLERGSLDAWLHGDAEGGEALPWPARLRVARGAAAALAFLHHDRRPPVLHRDVKSSNVLLGEGFEAKLADFGLARIVRGSPAKSHVSTQAAGTAGYVAPEIWAGVGTTAKADVYSFGVLVMEIVTGHRPSWPVKAKIGEKEVDMVDWAREKIGGGQASEILDRRMGIEGQGKEMDEVKGLLEIAWQCTDALHKNRPTMEEVVTMLNKI